MAVLQSFRRKLPVETVLPAPTTDGLGQGVQTANKSRSTARWGSSAILCVPSIVVQYGKIVPSDRNTYQERAYMKNKGPHIFGGGAVFFGLLAYVGWHTIHRASETGVIPKGSRGLSTISLAIDPAAFRYQYQYDFVQAAGFSVISGALLVAAIVCFVRYR